MAEFAKVANRSVKRQKRSADDACSNSKRLRQATDSLTNGSPAVLEDDQNDSFSQFSLTQNGDTGHTDQPENGIVESLELRNFMCHQNLKINFGEKINFVIGKNGSGKSAIMTGIVVGLGGNAAHTNRALSLKGLIMQGCPSATVIVSLCNRGSDSFQNEKYGDSVIVERKIAADGGGGHYKLRSQDGKVVSTKKEDLQQVLDHFNIQVNNPVSLLNQDTSRNFLHSSKPAHKYELFMKATQLEQLTVDYQQILEQKDVMSKSLEMKKKGLPELEREVMQWEEKFKNLTQLDQLSETKHKVEEELAWAQVIGLEKERDRIAHEIEKKERSTPKYSDKVEQCKAEAVKRETAMSEVEEKLKTLTHAAEDFQKRQKSKKEDLSKKKAACGKAKRDLDMISHEQRGEERTRNELQEQLEKLMTTSRQSTEKKRLRQIARKQELQDKVRELQGEMGEDQRSKTNLEGTIHQKQEQSYGMRNKESDTRKQLDHQQRELSGLERNRGNKLQVYGDWMPHLVTAIDNETSFHNKPRGPIGRYITLKEEKWALAVEAVLGKELLSSFCCHDQHDLQLLRRLMGRHCPGDKQPSVIKQTFRDRPYDTARARPRSKQLTFFDIVKCTDPVVFNVLIDQRRVESILMIERVDVAKRVMHINTPAGAKEAFTQQGDHLFGGTANRFYSCGKSRPHFVQQSVEGRIAELKEQLDQSQQTLQKLQQERRRVENEKDMSARELDQVKVKLHRKEHELSQLRRELQELDLLDDDANPVDVTALQEELEEHNNKISMLSQQSQTLTEEYEEMNYQYREQKKEVNGEIEKVQGTISEMDEVKSQIEALARAVSEAKGHQRHYEGKLQQLMTDIASKQSDLDGMRRKVLESTETAIKICERVETRATVKDLEIQLNRIEKVIAEEEKRQGSRETIIMTYHELKTRYEETTRVTRSLELCLKRLKEMMDQRVKRLKYYRVSLAVRLKIRFQMLMSQRGYDGKMIFDHNAKQLKLEVKVEESDTSLMVKDMKSLSGGERSFTTVCFILTLWDAVESPFRMLDEFDVFMDMVNRRVSMAMLLKAAREKNNKQFVFLTPQDLSAHIGAPDVRTHRLHDPDRNQATLNFGRSGSSRDG